MPEIKTSLRRGSGGIFKQVMEIFTFKLYLFRRYPYKGLHLGNFAPKFLFQPQFGEILVPNRDSVENLANVMKTIRRK